MKEIELEEIKNIQVDILVKVHEFCQQKGIRYYMGYGTLLGAVRHKGYIPWDDDIDIGMPRPDYDRFISTFNGNYKELSVIAPELDWSFTAPYANVYDNRTILNEGMRRTELGIGIKIDVFPIDGVPDDYNDYVYLRKNLHKLLEIIGYKQYGFKGFLELIRRPKSFIAVSWLMFPYVFTSVSTIQRKIRKMATQFDFSSSQYVDKITFQNKPLTRLPRAVYEEFVDMEFEGHVLKGLRNYDAHLKAIYGDYMQLPPIEQRVQHHGFKAFWK